MKTDPFFQDCLQHLLKNEEQKARALEAAACALPQPRKRIGLLTSDQRRWLVRTWLPKTWWPGLAETDKKWYLEHSQNTVSSQDLLHAQGPDKASHPVAPASSPPTAPGPAVPFPKKLAASPPAPRELFPEESPASSSTRKSRSSTWSTFGKRARADRVKAITDIIQHCCTSPEDAADLACAVLQKINQTVPGTAQRVSERLSQAYSDCCCRTLLPSLGKLRETWLNHPKSLVSLLDDAVCAGGLSSAKRMRTLGYSVSNRRVRQWHQKKLTKKAPAKPVGRPSKVNSKLNIMSARAVLDKNSAAASLTCVVKEKQEDGSLLRVRKQRRTLTAQLSTIYRSSPSIYRNMAETQFRAIVSRHCREYRKGFRKTDLCDHCLTYKRKILPRVAAFIRRCQDTMNAVCPSYWIPFWRIKRLGLTKASIYVSCC